MTDSREEDRRRVVLVTGASRGIGRTTSEHLATDGWRVFATVRDSRAGTRAQHPSELTYLHADVRDTLSLRSAIADLLAATRGRLNAVVANAGIAAVGTFEDTPAEVMAALMETNYHGVLNTVREALPALRANQGRIVVISSDSAIYGTAGLSGYSASKFALEGWAESVAYELRPAGILLSIIRPGAFRTDIWQSQIYRQESSAAPQLAETVAANWRAAANRAADPSQVAKAVAKALTENHPRLRYTVGGDARRAAFLRRMLPDSLFFQFVERGNKLTRPG